MREKLFVLWGNLQEVQKEGHEYMLIAPKLLDNRPFECIIAEYGVETSPDNWEPRHRITQTTIM